MASRPEQKYTYYISVWPPGLNKKYTYYISVWPPGLNQKYTYYISVWPPGLNKNIHIIFLYGLPAWTKIYILYFCMASRPEQKYTYFISVWPPGLNKKYTYYISVWPPGLNKNIHIIFLYGLPAWTKNIHIIYLYCLLARKKNSAPICFCATFQPHRDTSIHVWHFPINIFGFLVVLWGMQVLNSGFPVFQDLGSWFIRPFLHHPKLPNIHPNRTNVTSK